MNRIEPVYPDPPDPDVAAYLSELLLRRLADELLHTHIEARSTQDRERNAMPREEARR